MLEELIIDSGKKPALYLQIVEGVAALVEEGKLLPGTRMPSIRSFCRSFGVSKTTAETGYQILAAEGFLESFPKRGYFVAGKEGAPSPHPSSSPHASSHTSSHTPSHTPAHTSSHTPSPPEPAYDFGTYFIDEAYFDAPNWKRHMNYVLRDERSLTRYGEPQGELELRQAVSRYLLEYRGVYADPEEIVIGAGFQSLLHLLLPLLGEEPGVVLFPEGGFPAAEAVFRQGGWTLQSYATLQDPSPAGALRYLRPGDFGLATHKERLAFLEDVRNREALILEDDFNGEFRWGKRPVPALRSLDRFDNIVYFGAFSGILAPSIRISYMILPKHLLPRLSSRLETYTQTSSTVEQLALAKFISNGFLARQVRKMRKGYAGKREQLTTSLRELFGRGCRIRETTSTVELRASFPGDRDRLDEAARNAGVRLKPLAAPGEFLFIFAGLPLERIRPGVEALATAWKGLL